MALEGQPILDHKASLIWENNPDTPITATALSKASDLSVSYLDFKYNDPITPLHKEGTILIADPDESHSALKLVLKRGLVFSIINQVDEVTYPNGQYKIFDTGLDDLWITQDNKDNASMSEGGWGVNKQWFVFICDERINNQETGKNEAAILVSQSNKYPQNTQVPGTSELFSEKDTRIIGGFKTDNFGYIKRDSVWDISGKFNKVKSKQYMILDEYATSDNGQHIYRPLRISDLDSSGIDSVIDGDLLVSGSCTIGSNITVNNKIITPNIEIKDNNDIVHSISKNINGLSSGVVLKTTTNPNPSEPIFSVTSSDNSERLRVEHDGKVATTNNTISINGIDITKDLNVPTGSDILGVDGYFYATRVYNAVYNDLAEYFKTDSQKKPEPGKVYVISQFSDKAIRKSNKKGDRNVIGVCSDTPAYVMKQEYEKDGGIPICLTGTIDVWVESKIKRGDELMSDKNGFACKADIFTRIFKRDAIIGKAMESSYNSTARRIQLLVR